MADRAPEKQSWDSQHEENINDCQYDFYGTTVASCDSNGYIQITGVKPNGGAEGKPEMFNAHEGPCWQVCFAHPKFDSLLASCGYDKKVKIWRKTPTQGYQEIFCEDLKSSVNCIAWAPWEYGLVLAAGCAEGRVYVFTQENQQQEAKFKLQTFSFIAHAEGVNGLSWGPSTQPAKITDSESQSKHFMLPPKRLATCGNDKQVKVWQLTNTSAEP